MALCVTGEDDRILITSTGIDLLNPGRILEGLANLQSSAAARSGGNRERAVAEGRGDLSR